MSETMRPTRAASVAVSAAIRPAATSGSTVSASTGASRPLPWMTSLPQSTFSRIHRSPSCTSRNALRGVPCSSVGCPAYSPRSTGDSVSTAVFAAAVSSRWTPSMAVTDAARYQARLASGLSSGSRRSRVQTSSTPSRS
ncbi:hypothetical protein AMK13_17625 [Streptomyces sp. CB02056]|nr:hypothetical protein AMK13_17625 [Streptomyces sp. CB02056]